MAFIGIRLYMGIHQYPSIESYWNNSNLYTNITSSIILKNYYFIYKMFIIEEEELTVIYQMIITLGEK